MGFTSYSSESYSAFSEVAQTKSRQQIFTQDECHQTMDPHGLEFRECRDSEAHPNTVPIIIALDVTGSMGFIPERIIKNDLGHIIETLTKAGINDPAICFVAVGDKLDLSPLQVGQFESGDQELVMWLERTWLEGHGGGGNRESYDLAWLFAAQHTKTDAWEKRGQKGFLFTIGDERNWERIEGGRINEIMGYKQSHDYTPNELLKMAKEKWDVVHIHVTDGSYTTEEVEGFWRPLLGQNFMPMNSSMIAKRISQYVLRNVNVAVQESPDDSPSEGGDTMPGDDIGEVISEEIL